MKDIPAHPKRRRVRWAISGPTALLLASPVLAQPATPTGDPVRVLVKRLDLEKYKATIKGLTQFGDRRQGTARNRAAIDWIEAQLKSYGCADVQRLTYTFTPRAPQRGRGTAPDAGAPSGATPATATPPTTT